MTTTALQRVGVRVAPILSGGRLLFGHTLEYARSP